MLSKCMILSLRSRQLGHSLVIVELIHHIVLLISMGYMHTTAPPPASFNSTIFSILFRFEDKDKRRCWRRWKSMMTRTLGMPQKNNLAVFWTLFKRAAVRHTHIGVKLLKDWHKIDIKRLLKGRRGRGGRVTPFPQPSQAKKFRKRGTLQKKNTTKKYLNPHFFLETN